MKINKIIKGIFKEEPMHKQFKEQQLLTDSLAQPFLRNTYFAYESKYRNNEEEIIKTVLKSLEEKNSVFRKIKILMFWIQMSKATKYDLADILMNKKIKAFSKPVTLKSSEKELNKSNLEAFLNLQILVPLYNYFMKLSVNEELYKTCVIGIIPDDQIFRRGTKIRFIWIFKIYNLIILLIPILKSLLKFIKKFSDLKALQEITHYLYKDILFMNNFVVKAIEEGSEDNFLLMPYFDMLQFSESLTQQISTAIQIEGIYKKMCELLVEMKDAKEKIEKPKRIRIDSETLEQIETQSLRIKLISQSLKNPKKDYTRLETEYHEKLEERGQKAMKTEIYDKPNMSQEFHEKYIHLD